MEVDPKGAGRPYRRNSLIFIAVFIIVNCLQTAFYRYIERVQRKSGEKA
jgi:hypothetical protein